jgi:hypothetical protein
MQKQSSPASQDSFRITALEEPETPTTDPKSLGLPDAEYQELSAGPSDMVLVDCCVERAIVRTEPQKFPSERANALDQVGDIGDTLDSEKVKIANPQSLDSLYHPPSITSAWLPVASVQ